MTNVLAFVYTSLRGPFLVSRMISVHSAYIMYKVDDSVSYKAMYASSCHCAYESLTEPAVEDPARCCNMLSHIAQSASTAAFR